MARRRDGRRRHRALVLLLATIGHFGRRCARISELGATRRRAARRIEREVHDRTVEEATTTANDAEQDGERCHDEHGTRRDEAQARAEPSRKPPKHLDSRYGAPCARASRAGALFRILSQRARPFSNAAAPGLSSAVRVDTVISRLPVVVLMQAVAPDRVVWRDGLATPCSWPPPSRRISGTRPATSRVRSRSRVPRSYASLRSRAARLVARVAERSDHRVEGRARVIVLDDHFAVLQIHLDATDPFELAERCLHVSVGYKTSRSCRLLR